MALFNIPTRATKNQDIAIASKSKSKTKSTTTIKGGSGLLGRIAEIKAMVERNLGQYADDYEIIISKQRLQDYLKKCVLNKVIAIDTETTGLDPIQDKIVGLCLYTPNEKAVYVPINHISYITEERVDNQLTEQEVADELRVICDWHIEVIMFNAKFDMRVIRNQLGIKNIYCTWDCYLAARLMNENEGHGNNGLKQLHKKYVLDGKGDAFSFDSLFNGISFNLIPINVGYLYAAHDAIITYELYQFQKQYMYYQQECSMDDRNGMNGVAWVFFNIEMPLINVVCDMEDNGIELDIEYAKKLSIEYHKKVEDIKQQFYTACEEYADKIERYRSSSDKLDNPINIASASQIAILLYDVLNIEPVDPKSPRGTGEEILSKIDNPICKIILDYRTVDKLIGTYIDKLPECVNPKDGRIHCNFNQYGADTGRFSSSDPNLQNIPSHNKDIRKMFKATDGYVLMSSDFSQQEPKCLAALCRRQGDPQMYDTFMQGKDLYSEIASKSFNKAYEECREFNADGSTNAQGKERRTQAKSILLGVLYGRGESSIAEQLNCSVDKAKAIKQSVFRAFPAIKKFEQDSLDMAYEVGYVTTVCGRKRRLPDLQLEEYEFVCSEDSLPFNNDILDFDAMNEPEEDVVPIERQNFYLRKLQNCRFSEKRKIFEQANKEGIWIIDNGKKIADATRQCVNSRIQGSAADLTKLAMIKLSKNERLRELGFRLLIPVHDEVIAECPEENAKECSELLAKVMSSAAEQILEMPIKCDVEITKAWYGEKIKV